MSGNLLIDAALLEGVAGVRGPKHHSSVRMQLFLTPVARKDGLYTSRVAAKPIAGHAKDLRGRVFAHIAPQGSHGSSDDGAEAALGIKPQSYTPRCVELVAFDLVVDSGPRRATQSGRPAAVWVASTHARVPEAGAA